MPRAENRERGQEAPRRNVAIECGLYHARFNLLTGAARRTS
jgi:hypothetical protein